MFQEVTHHFNALTASTQSALSAQDILKLPTAVLKNLIQTVVVRSKSTEFKDKMHDEGLLYFHVAWKVFQSNDPVLIQTFERFSFRRHIGEKLNPHSFVFYTYILILQVVISLLEHGAYGVVFQVEDTKPDPNSPTSYAMKIQDEGAEYRREFKILSQLNSDRIVRLKKGA